MLTTLAFINLVNQSLPHISASFQVYAVCYRVNTNGEAKEGSLGIDSDNNPEQFKTGSGEEESVEIHNFQIASEFVLVLSFSGDCVLSKGVRRRV